MQWGPLDLNLRDNKDSRKYNNTIFQYLLQSIKIPNNILIDCTNKFTCTILFCHFQLRIKLEKWRKVPNESHRIEHYDK